MGVVLSAQSLGKSFGHRPLFEGVCLGIEDGERVGLIGPNGSGKSTLLRILAGFDPPDAGTLALRKGLRVAYVPQRDEFPAGATVLEVVVGAVDPRREEHEREVHASITLGRVGFERFDARAEDLSGGWRKRLALARELAREPDLLLVDEPTNHLDLEGIAWLEELIRGAPFASIVVTHDRWFLDAVCTTIVELSRAYPGGTFRVDGAYGKFLSRRADFLEAQAQEQQALAGKVRRDLEWLKRGPRAQRCKSRSMIDAAGRRQEELAELQYRTAPNRAAGIDFSATGRQTQKLLAAKGIAKSLGGRELFRGLDLTLSPGMRLGLIGPNGSGKTSLIRVLTGELAPDAGTIERAEQLRVVTFTQHREDLDPDMNLRRALSAASDEVFYQGRKVHVSGWARRFLFHTDQLITRVGDLSGGEQARILIARLMLEPADLLILDEPTNDLDIPSLEVLEESLEEFPGALVLVTHDRFMLERISTDILGLDGQGGAGLYADLDQWEAARASRRAPPTKVAAPRVVAPAARPKKLTYHEQREWERMEESILAAEAEAKVLETRAHDPSIQSDHVRLQEACRALDEAQGRVAALYARWEELEARQKGGSA